LNWHDLCGRIVSVADSRSRNKLRRVLDARIKPIKSGQGDFLVGQAAPYSAARCITSSTARAARVAGASSPLRRRWVSAT
jgi:hypothetical protein